MRTGGPRTVARTGSGWAGWALCLVAVAAAACPAHVRATTPNVLLVLSDDQPLATGPEAAPGLMPNLERYFRDRGTEFTNYWTGAVCCLSRASIFSGEYPHNTHVWSNDDGANFDPAESWECELRAAGFDTGILGKYLNGIDAEAAPCWRFARGLPDDQTEPGAIVAGLDRFLRGEDRRDRTPWTFELSTHMPHRGWPPCAEELCDPVTEPQKTAPLELRPFPAWARPANYGESDLSDKSPVVRSAASRFKQRVAHRFRLGEDAELEALDEVIPAIVGALKAHGETHRTLVIYTSDNGYLWGQHGLLEKTWPYPEDLHVPLFARWPGHLEAGTTDDRLTAMVDLAPTVFDLYGIEPDYAPDGRSIFDPSYARHALLFEYGDPGMPRRYAGLYLPGIDRYYVDWRVQSFVEDYDLASDPAMLRASNLPDLLIQARLDEARACAGDTCP